MDLKPFLRENAKFGLEGGGGIIEPLAFITLLDVRIDFFYLMSTWVELRLPFKTQQRYCGLNAERYPSGSTIWTRPDLAYPHPLPLQKPIKTY